ncbi:hypothetical protein [Dactylosporangium sp. NPDC051541]|uniref:hypothetical protein n=1 Tax=Dactylosporangium sp. NPDC051541 TaxID=3363977 RepID=UPI00379E59E3
MQIRQLSASTGAAIALLAVSAALALTGCTAAEQPRVPTLGGSHSAAPTTGGCISAAAGLSQLNADLAEKAGPSPGVKTDNGGGGNTGEPLGYQPTCAGATGDDRKNALHAAAECIRQHGIPTYKDPVLTADGHVYTDARSLREADGTTILAAAAACDAQIRAAELVPDGQAPAPPKLVQAGVRSAQCMRANGLPNFRDPTANDLFTPGHGFGMHPEDLPGDKSDPTVRHALDTCRSVLDDEARVSSLGNLAS